MELLILLSPCTADLLLVVSPVVPPRCYGQVLAVCERRGFSLSGLQRLQLQSNGAAVLGLTNPQVELQDTQSEFSRSEEQCMTTMKDKKIGYDFLEPNDIRQ